MAKTLQVRISDDQYNSLVEAAKGKPVSVWVRDMLFAPLDAVDTQKYAQLERYEAVVEPME